MSALRVSVPGRLALIDLGPGRASSGEIRGTLATPVAVPDWVRPRAIPDPEKERARQRAWRLANMDKVRASEARRAERKRETRAAWEAAHREERNARRRINAAIARAVADVEGAA